MRQPGSCIEIPEDEEVSSAIANFLDYIIPLIEYRNIRSKSILLEGYQCLDITSPIYSTGIRLYLSEIVKKIRVKDSDTQVLKFMCIEKV